MDLIGYYMCAAKKDYVPTGNEMTIVDRLLFLKYALPCAGTLVKRGGVSQDYVDRLILQVSRGSEPDRGAERMFVVANVMCTRIAKEMHKKSVDSEVIRNYFLFNHSKVVDDRFDLMKDFNPVDCKTYAGKVIDVHDGYATVETVLGRKKYNTIFEKGVKKNDDVVVHFDFIIEKILPETAEKMNEMRAAYEKGN